MTVCQTWKLASSLLGSKISSKEDIVDCSRPTLGRQMGQITYMDREPSGIIDLIQVKHTWNIFTQGFYIKWEDSWWLRPQKLKKENFQLEHYPSSETENAFGSFAYASLGSQVVLMIAEVLAPDTAEMLFAVVCATKHLSPDLSTDL